MFKSLKILRSILSLGNVPIIWGPSSLNNYKKETIKIYHDHGTSEHFIMN
jgi:hypothetical protein